MLLVQKDRIRHNYKNQQDKDKISQMRKYITAEGIQQLDRYQYKPGKYTTIDNLLTPYWNYVVTLVPEWVAPNLITFIGFLIFLSSTVVIFLYDFTFKESIPSWCFFYAAASLWIYTTMDAIDGKQARRTRSSSPLGQLFDHGCDAFGVSFILINMGEAAQLQNLHIFLLYFSTYTAFFFANWKEYNTGVLMTSMANFGVTECELLCMLLYLISGYCGQEVWKFSPADVLPSFILSINIPLLQQFLKVNIGGLVCYFFATLIFGLTALELIRTILETRSIKSLKEFFSLFVLIGCASFWMKFTFFTKNIGIILFSFGLMIALVVCKMIIASVTKMKLQTFHKELIPLIITTAGMWILEVMKMQKAQFFVFWLFFFTMVFLAYKFLSTVIQELASHLGIYCFSLQKREKKEQNIQKEETNKDK